MKISLSKRRLEVSMRLFHSSEEEEVERIKEQGLWLLSGFSNFSIATDQLLSLPL